MRSVAAWNLGAFAAALVLSTTMIWIGPSAAPSASAWASSEHGPGPLLVDHSGQPLPARHFARIASRSTVADDILLELCEPDRIVAFTRYSARQSAKSCRFSGRPVVGDDGDIERLLVLQPDLVLVSRIGDGRAIAQMRQAGP